MPEPITIAFILGKWLTAHTAAAHVAVGGAAAGSGHIGAILFAGVAAGTTLYAICLCLIKLVEARIFSGRDAKGFKEKAEVSSEPVKKEMLRDAQALLGKYGINA